MGGVGLVESRVSIVGITIVVGTSMSCMGVLIIGFQNYTVPHYKSGNIWGS